MGFENTSFDVFELGREWFADVVQPVDIEEYYRGAIMKQTRWSILSFLGSAIFDPKIFHVLKPNKAVRFASMDAWFRMMWQGDELPRWIREAIAVLVSFSNHCGY